MSEIKTIKGKVEFLCIPFEGDYERKSHLVTKYTHPDFDPYKTHPSFLLSEATEEQASLLVNSFIFSDEESGKYTAYTDYLDEYGFVMTAKESLFSLLKVNGCWVKEWFDSTTVAHMCDEAYQWQQAPDDYLLIIKQC